MLLPPMRTGDYTSIQDAIDADQSLPTRTPLYFYKKWNLQRKGEGFQLELQIVVNWRKQRKNHCDLRRLFQTNCLVDETVTFMTETMLNSRQ